MDKKKEIVVTGKKADELHEAMCKAQIDPYDMLWDIIREQKSSTVKYALMSVVKTAKENSEKAFGIWNDIFLDKEN